MPVFNECAAMRTTILRISALTTQSVGWTTKAARARTGAWLLPLRMTKEWGEGEPCQLCTHISSAQKEPLSLALSPLVPRGERGLTLSRLSCDVLNASTTTPSSLGPTPAGGFKRARTIGALSSGFSCPCVAPWLPPQTILNVAFRVAVRTL